MQLPVFEEILDAISELNFQHLPAGWTNYIWESNFSDSQPLQDDDLENVIDSESLVRILTFCSTKCRHFASVGGESFWAELANSGQLRPFIAFLYYTMDMGQKTSSTNQAKRRGLMAGNVYVILCAITGGSAYHVFNNCLFQKSLEGINKAAASLRQSRPLSRNGHGVRGRGRGWGRGRATVANNNRSSLSSIDALDSNVDDEPFDCEEAKSIILDFLKIMWTFVGHYSLKDNDDCLDNISTTLCHLLTVSSYGVDSTSRADGEMDLMDRSAAGLAFGVLHKLFENDNDDKYIEAVSRSVFQNLLPHLLMIYQENGHANASAAMVPVELVKRRDLVLAFVISLLKDHASVIKSICLLMRHLCTRVTDKADYRAKVSQEVITLAMELPGGAFQQFLTWLNIYARNQRISYRGFAVDVVLNLYYKSVEKIHATERQGQDEAKKVLELCLQLVVERCMDKAASVRCRALTSLSQILEPILQQRAMGPSSVGNLVKQLLCQLASAKGLRRESGEVNMVNGTHTSGDEMEEDPPRVAEPLTVQIPTEAPCSTDLASQILQRCDDERPLVRKAAVQAFQCLAVVVPGCVNEKVIAILGARCTDVATSVRKQAIQSLMVLVLNRQDEQLEKAWLHYVLPLMLDRETTVQEKCIEAFGEVVIDNLFPDQLRNGEDEQRAWRLIHYVTQDGAMTRFVQKILQHLQRTNAAQLRDFVGIIETATTIPSKSAAAWFLLSELADHSSLGASGLKDIWDSGSLTGNVLNYALKIIAAKAKTMPKALLEYFSTDIKRRLQNYSFPPENIAAALKMLWHFWSVGKHEGFHEWCTTYGQDCVKYLSTVVFEAAGDGATKLCGENVIRRVFTLGELFQFSPSSFANQRNFYIVVALVASTTKSAELANRSDSSLDQRPEGSSILQNGEAIENIRPGRLNVDVTPALRSHAVAALGKLCLEDGGFAKRTVSILVAELDSDLDAANATVRNNIIIVMSDLCLRYTSLIDNHVGRISRRLRDTSSLVRKQTMTLLTNLLKEDYLKWRGALLFRFLTGLLDAEMQVRSFAEFCLSNILGQRQPAMLYMHFLECLFYFNDARHPSWYSAVDVEIDKDQKEQFSLSGNDRKDWRLVLYKFMLRRFTDQQRFETTRRICQEILGAVADEALKLDDNVEQVVADSLIVLSSKEIKLTSLSTTKKSAQDDLGEDAEVARSDPAAVAFVEAAKKSITQAVKREVLECITPTLKSLRIILRREKRQRLLHLLISYVKELAKDYKEEMKDILARDTTLLREMDYDVNRNIARRIAQLD